QKRLMFLRLFPRKTKAAKDFKAMRFWSNREMDLNHRALVPEQISAYPRFKISCTDALSLETYFDGDDPYLECTGLKMDSTSCAKPPTRVFSIVAVTLSCFASGVPGSAEIRERV